MGNLSPLPPDHSAPCLPRVAVAGGSWGRPVTHPDVQVLEEDEERLSNQLELPVRESSVSLPEAKQRDTSLPEVR